MTPLKIKWIIFCLVLASCIVAGIAAIGVYGGNGSSLAMSTDSGGPLSPIQGSTEKLIMDTSFPKAPVTVPLYTVKSVETIQEVNEKLSMTIKNSIPTADEAPALAEKSLEAYGGLPKDARLINAIPLYRVKYNITTNTDEEKYPVRTQVRYIQKIDGYPVYKAGISLMLGEKGEILDIYKNWITAYEISGEAQVISAEEGFEKLQKVETTAELQGNIPEGSKISDIEFGYYLDKKNGNALKPIWVYKAIMGPDMEPFNLYVDAAR
jgi:Zn-dependent metalloprotease